jgi:hypothetical protein
MYCLEMDYEKDIVGFGEERNKPTLACSSL